MQQLWTHEKFIILVFQAHTFGLNDLNVAKPLIAVMTNSDPFVLFQDLLLHLKVEERNEFNPTFLGIS